MTDMLKVLPSLPDEKLENLRVNAARLEANGTAAQKKSASALLPAILAEIAGRKPAKPTPVRAKAAPRRKHT